MAEGKKQLLPLPFFLWLTTGMFVGLLAGAVVVYQKPKVYESRAVADVKRSAESVTRISLAHSALIARNLDLPQLQNRPLDQIAAEISENSTIRSSPEGTEIVARMADKFDARDIALQAAGLFRSVRHESELDRNPVRIGELTEEDKQALNNFAIIARNLDAQAAEFGIADFREAETLAEEGSEAAKDLIADEFFQDRIDALREISSRVGIFGLPGTAWTPPPALLVRPLIPDYPVGPNIQLHLNAGLAGGLVLGLIAGAVLGRRVPPPVAPPPDHGTPRPPSSEEEW